MALRPLIYTKRDTPFDLHDSTIKSNWGNLVLVITFFIAEIKPHRVVFVPVLCTCGLNIMLILTFLPNLIPVAYKLVLKLNEYILTKHQLFCIFAN